MDIWTIKNGEKIGPIPDYEVRHRIESGDFVATTPAWHDGLTEWTQLGKISLFEREFIPDSNTSPPPDEPATPSIFSKSPSQPTPKTESYAIRRFWARWFDLYLYGGLWWLTIWATNRSIEAALGNLWLMFFLYLPWFVLEILMIHCWATTPGKWLLGIRVINEDGSHLSLQQSSRRAARVFFLGIGMGWGVIALICQIFSLVAARRTGKPLWDLVGNHRVETKPLSPLRLAAYVIVLFLSLQLQTAVLTPYMKELVIERFPALRESFEQAPRWQLPPRAVDPPEPK